VAVTLAYDLWLRPQHDRDILELVEASLIKDGPRFGLMSIERRIDYREIFDSLTRGDELLWLDTYCPGRDFLDPLRNALERGASVAMLAVEPNSLSADFRGKEMTTSQPEEFRAEVAGFIELIKNEVEHNDSIRRDGDGIATTRPPRWTEVPRDRAAMLEASGQHPDRNANGAQGKAAKVDRTERRKPYLQILTYSDLPCVPMYIICREGQPVVAWTSYFLRKGSYDIPHLTWVPARDGMLNSFMGYFEEKWSTAADETSERAQRRAVELRTRRRFADCKMDDMEFTRLMTQVFSERYDSDLATHATEGGWLPIVLSPATAKRRDVNYVIDLSPPRTEYGIQVYLVDVTFSAYRVVPEGVIWVSFTRTLEDLRDEFSEINCVARELVDVPNDTWEQMIADLIAGKAPFPFSAKLRWENQGASVRFLRAECVPGATGTTIVRLMFAKHPRAEGTSGKAVYLEVHLSFYVSADMTHLPVRFPAYFCLGHTVVQLTVRDEAIDPTSLDALVSFAGDSIESPIESIERNDSSTIPQSIRVQTKPGSMLWPGSGAVFLWKHRTVSASDHNGSVAEPTNGNVGESRLGC
jgi:hypothetical protein